jgi:drug/metabolite transporter (DMT)-like permease
LLFVSANGLATVGVKYISGGLGALIAALYPLSVVLMEKIVFRNRRIAAMTWLGIALGFAGIVLVFYDNAFHHPGPGYWKGVFFSVVAMLSWGAGTILIARKPITGVNPYFTMGWEMLFGAFFLLLLSLATGTTVALADIPANAWKAIAYLVAMGSLIAVVAFLYTMKHLEPTIAALYAYINPIVAMLIGAFLIHEPLTPLIGLGAMVTLTGVYLVNRSLKTKSA